MVVMKQLLIIQDATHLLKRKKKENTQFQITFIIQAFRFKFESVSMSKFWEKHFFTITVK